MKHKSKLTTEKTIRAWTDRRYRKALSDDEKLELLDSPIGAVFVDLRGRGDGAGAADDDTCALNTSFCVIISETFGTTCPAPSDDDTDAATSGIGGFAIQYGTFYCPSE